MAGENFCLKWNDHHSVFFSNIESLCEKSFLTDVILSAGGQMYPAHKLVLCICSTYFQVRCIGVNFDAKKNEFMIYGVL